MKFADIPLHEEAKARLRLMVDTGRIPHALLIEGPSGTGKFMLARAFAQYIHCTDRRNGDSCGVCPSCRQHQEFNHIDTVFSFPVVKKGKGALSDDYIEDFREFMTESPYMDFEQWLVKLDNINAQPQIYVEEGNELLRRLTYMTRSARFKVVLMWLPERLKEETANKLLKLVEEPFADTIFVMVSNNASLILPTIYSRTQRLQVLRFTDEELRRVLVERGMSPADAASVAPLAEGSVNTAYHLAGESELRKKHFDMFTGLMRKAYARKVRELRQWSVDAAALGREGAMRFIDYAARLVRESFIMHLRNDKLLTLTPEERAFATRFHPFINEKNVEDMIRLLDNARRDIAANGNAKLVFFDVAVRIIILLRR